MAEGQTGTSGAPPRALATLHKLISQVIQSELDKDGVSRDVTGRIMKPKGKSGKTKGKGKSKGA